jgi:O-antigen ligase
MTLPFYRTATTFWKRLPLYLFTCLAAVCIVLTGSRTGFVGLAVFSVMCLFLSRSRVKMLFLLGALALVAVVLMPDYLQDRFLTLIDPSYGPHNAQESVEGRFAGFAHGFELWSQSPLVGFGPGSFALATGSGCNSHNVYGQVVGEMGALGAVVFAGVLLCFLANWLETAALYRRHPEWRRDFVYQTSRSAAICVLLLLFLGWAGHNLYRYQWLWLGAFQAIALHCRRRRAALAGQLPRRWPSLFGRRPVIVRSSARFA